MPSGGEQAGWVAIGVAVVAAIANIVDRLIGRWWPQRRARAHSRNASADELERERIRLAKEWDEYRKAVNAQLLDCRQTSVEQQARIETLNGENVTLRLRVGMLEAQMRAHGIPTTDG